MCCGLRCVEEKEHIWLVEQRLPSRCWPFQVVIQISYLSSVYLLSAFYVIPQIVFSLVSQVSEYDTILTNSASGLKMNAFFSSHLLPLFIFV